jgi:chemotaxis protein CheD
MGSLTSVPFEHRVVVGVADLAVSNNQSVVLTTYSLGSCLGIAVFDPVVRVGGLLHLMLPDSRLDSTKAEANPAMFVDSGMQALLRAAGQLNADRRRLLLYVAGGAQILDDGGFFNIGRRNYDALKALLAKEKLAIMAEAVGGQVNRTMCLRISTGQVSLKVSGNANEIQLCRS